MATVKKITNYIIARPKLFNFIKPIADRYCDLAGYRKVGLMYEDLLREESHTVQLALKRLPPRIAYDRAFRIRRALQCSVTHTLLPKEEWIKPEEDVPYLSPYIEEIEQEEAERKMFDALTRK
ncbi:Cytochrome b-c1 complex subunit 7 [Arthrobotrys musiformis]|uniref:Cytochrome b-c1 complex subunit 7 n=1 Tax=Arthrobotrys musiformis TaxID=47236 RepID=A0AAV9VZI1_9PEZI